MEFLTDVQAAAFGRFGGSPARVELERFFFLDDADRELIARRRAAHNRLGFALQLGTVRFLVTFLVTFLADPLDVPTLVVDFLAEQLQVLDGSVVKVYAERPARAGRAQSVQARRRARVRVRDVLSEGSVTSRFGRPRSG